MEVLSPGTFAEEQGSLQTFWFVWRYEISVSIIKTFVFLISPDLAIPFLLAVSLQVVALSA